MVEGGFESSSTIYFLSFCHFQTAILPPTGEVQPPTTVLPDNQSVTPPKPPPSTSEREKEVSPAEKVPETEGDCAPTEACTSDQLPAC